MNKYYLEFLSELNYLLKQDKSSSWHSDIEKCINHFLEDGKVDYYFRLFGGMGSFNDYFYNENSDVACVINILKHITYDIAKSINDNMNTDINNILLKEQERYVSNIKKGYSDNFSEKNLTYIDYLIDNYSSSNLHSINENYFEQINNHKNLKK